MQDTQIAIGAEQPTPHCKRGVSGYSFENGANFVSVDVHQRNIDRKPELYALLEKYLTLVEHKINENYYYMSYLIRNLDSI